MLCTSSASHTRHSICNTVLHRIAAKNTWIPTPIFGTAPILVFFITSDASIGAAIAVEAVAPDATSHLQKHPAW